MNKCECECEWYWKWNKSKDTSIIHQTLKLNALYIHSKANIQ